LSWLAAGGEGKISAVDSLDRFMNALAEREDAEVPLNLDLGRPLVIPLAELPTLLMVSDPKVMDFTLESKHSVLLQPKGVGRTPMAMRIPIGRDGLEWYVITLQVKVQAAGSR
jgi:hypothetical protein